MAMTGKIKNRNGKLYVLYTTTEYSEPMRQYIWWRVHETARSPYNAQFPEDGDDATYQGNGRWSTHRSGGGSSGAAVTGDGHAQAELVERVSVEPPAARGKELRWNHGRWEKLMARGWEPAGEGSSRPKPKKAKKPSRGTQLDRDIAETLGKRGT